MGLTQYHHGIPFVVAVAFVSWLASGFNTYCFVIDYAPGYQPPPDARSGGCDSAFTSALRTLTGNMERKPFYDVIYDPGFSFLWMLGITFALWYAVRSRLLNRPSVSKNVGAL